MGRLRTALAAVALHEDDPARLLTDLDRFLCDAPRDPLATLAVGVLDPDGRAATFYSAGHLPAVDGLPDATTLLVDAPQVPPLGVGWSLQGITPSGTRVDLPEGSVVALCTDGLLETRTATSTSACGCGATPCAMPYRSGTSTSQRAVWSTSSRRLWTTTSRCCSPGAGRHRSYGRSDSHEAAADDVALPDVALPLKGSSR